MDCRLVGTLSQAVRTIIQHRHNSCGLLLSELGGHLLSGAKAPAGTKRLSNLLRSPGWSDADVERHLWQQAQQQVEQWKTQAHNADPEAQVLVLWDESVLEKPESQHAEGLSPVRSSKAARLTRIKPGYYRPPGPPVFCAGFALVGAAVLCAQWAGVRGGDEVVGHTCP